MRHAGSDPQADVTLLLEGTYPYAVGGVSTWVDGLIRHLPHHRFGIVHLYAGEGHRVARFERPANVAWQRDIRLPDELAAIDPAALAAQIPPGRIVHALATGFAGQVATALADRTSAPLLLTEHGIYWHEIAEGAPELECGLRLHGQDLSDGNPCASRDLWVQHFQRIARDTYAAASIVTTVCEANAVRQRQLGARDPIVIPNGVALPEETGPLSETERNRLHPSAREPASLRIGVVARVTPIKDLHAFVRAAALVRDRLPGARFFIVGPMGDAEYAASVERLAADLGLADRLHLTGTQPAALWHRHLDVVALTSRSEAEPLALLEAMAHGTAVVAPDLGGCRALIAGGDHPPAGLVVERPPADEAGTGDLAPVVAEAFVELASEDRRRTFGAGGRRRAEARSVKAVAHAYAARYGRLAEVRRAA